MKLLNFIILIFPLILWAQDPNCDEDISAFGKQTEFKNCANPDFKDLLLQNPPDTEKTCLCASEYRKNYEKFLPKLQVKPIETKILALNQLKKALAENLINIAKSRSIPQSQNTFSASTEACNIERFIKSSSCKDKSFGDELVSGMSNELANLMSKTPQYNSPGLLKRIKSNNSCNISDSSIMQASLEVLEENLTDTVINEVLSKQLNTPELIQQFLDFNKNPEIRYLFSNHPLLSGLIKSPDSFNTFFKSLKKPATSASVKDSLYNSSQLSGILDQNFAKSCTNAFKAYEEVCNSVEDKKIQFNSFDDAGPFFDESTFDNADEVLDPTQPNSLDNNNRVLQFCETINQPKKPFDLKTYNDKISKELPDLYKQSSFDNYKSQKYENEFEKIRGFICSEPDTCNETSQYCRMKKLIKKIENPETTEGRLASTTDESMKNLLRSFVGSNPSANASQNTKQVLISQGIWPKPDGTYTPQKKVAERERKFYSEQAAAERPSSPAASTQAAQAAAIAQPSAPRRAASNSNPEPIVPQSSPNSLPSTTASTVAQASTFDADMDELKRKVAQLKSDGHSQTGQPVRKAATSSKPNSQAAPTTLSASAASPRFSNEDDSETTSAAQGLGDFGSTPDNRDIRDAGELQNQRAYADRQKALSGMAGAKGSASGRSSAGSAGVSGADGAKPEATLAVTVPEEKLRSEITKILNVNELKNLETLASSRKDFTFKINEAVFQVKFNPSTRLYAVEVASSRNEMSDRLKSDLVDYLNKLNKRTNSLEALNKNFK